MHVIGAGGHAKVVLDIILSAETPVFGIWDENILVKSLLNNKILGTLNGFQKAESDQYIIAIGSNKIRKKIADQLGKSTSMALHASSVVGSNVELGEGTVLMPNVSVNAGSKVGKHVIINTNASVDHDCIIADFVHISPQVGLAGGVHVGEGTHIGIGASVLQNIKIGRWVTIGAGTVIISDVPDYAVVVGNPGKIIKYHKDEY